MIIVIVIVIIIIIMIVTLIANDCPPEINTSEVVADLQRHSPTDCQRLSMHILCAYIYIHIYIYIYIYICTHIMYIHKLQRHSPTDCQWHAPMEFPLRGFSCVICCPELRGSRAPYRRRPAWGNDKGGYGGCS